MVVAEDLDFPGAVTQCFDLPDDQSLGVPATPSPCRREIVSIGKPLTAHAPSTLSRDCEGAFQNSRFHSDWTSGGRRPVCTVSISQVDRGSNGDESRSRPARPIAVSTDQLCNQGGLRSLHEDQRSPTRDVRELESDQQVDVTALMRLTSREGAETLKPGHTVTPAKGREASLEVTIFSLTIAQDGCLTEPKVEATPPHGPTHTPQATEPRHRSTA